MSIRCRSPANCSSMPSWTRPSRVQPLAHARLGEEVDDALLEHPCADAGLDVLAAAVLENHRLDALEMQKLRERQARRPRADDRNLRSRHVPASRSNSAAWP